MTPERWQRVAELYRSAQELNRNEREGFLAATCNGDEELRKEVESLLAQESESDSFMERPAFEVAASALAAKGANSARTAGVALGIGAMLSHYRITAKLGAGGMGVVYEAEDTGLGRSVALKFLPAEFMEDQERLARFQREARLLASLNHPNIATIHGVEQSGGWRYLVMELIPGETLAERLKSGRLDTAEALGIAQQIAAALESAHEQGIVHRDLKPANVKVLPDGRVKVLDFGLAKASANGDGQAVAAVTKSEPGTILGTPGYMSPEQVRGKSVDKRADIWAFGCVLYEMLSGRRAFQGETITDILAAVVTNEPDWSAVPRLAPPGIRKLIRRCLVKDPMQRLRDIGDARIAIEEVQRGEVDADARERELPASRWHWTASLTLSVVGIAAVFAFLFRPALSPPRVTASNRVTYDGQEHSGTVTDGSRIYFSSIDAYSSSLNEVSVAGGATAPIQTSIETESTVQSPTKFQIIRDMSPDRSELLIEDCSIFFDDCPLFVLPLVGQSPRRVGDIRASDAAWSPDEKELVYAKGNALCRVRADGSESKKIVSLPESSHLYLYWPRWSPDGSHLRFTVLTTAHPFEPDRGSLWEVSGDGTNLHQLLVGWAGSSTSYCGNWTPDGKYFVFTSRSNGVDNIWAVREKTSIFRRVSKEPVQLTNGLTPTSVPLVSPDGKKLFVIVAQLRGELVSYNSTSHEFSPYLSGISATGLNFSADGKRVVYVRFPESTLWQSNVDGSDRVQLTFPPLTVLQPRWSPDGSRIAFMAREPGKPFSVYVIPSGGGAAEQPIPGNHLGADPNWSPDGKRLVFARYASELTPGAGTLDVEILDLQSHKIAKVPGSEGLWAPRWSPDNQIVAMQGQSGWLMRFDRGTQNWSPLVKMVVEWPEFSRRGEYVYFHGVEAPGKQGLFRVRVRDRKLELLFSLDNFRQPPVFGLWKGLAPDDSPLLLRDAGTQDIYALDVDFP